MIKFENTEVFNFQGAIRGMRNPKNSWDKSDSDWQIMNEEDHELGYDPEYEFVVGKNDLNLMKRLSNAGEPHCKYLRQIFVSVDITAPLYWWKEAGQNKVGVVTDSCSTMFTIANKEFDFDDFSHEHLFADCDNYERKILASSSMESLAKTIATLNIYRDIYLRTKDKEYWWQLIQLLPLSYNQKRTVTLNYAVLKNMYKSRCITPHRLDEWNVGFRHFVHTLPYSELITGEE